MKPPPTWLYPYKKEDFQAVARSRVDCPTPCVGLHVNEIGPNGRISFAEVAQREREWPAEKFDAWLERVWGTRCRLCESCVPSSEWTKIHAKELGGDPESLE